MEIYKQAEKNAGETAYTNAGAGKMAWADNRESAAVQAKLIRGIRTASPAIQRSGDFSASVALRMGGPEESVPAENLFIDTIKLTGRTNTGLTKLNTKKQKREPTQGDHIIADTFMKTYQKVMLRDQNILAAIGFYENNFQNIVKAENTLPAVDESLTSQSEQEQRKQVVDQEVREGMSKIEMLKNGERPIYLWRKGLVQVINSYNEAYSHSKAATVYNSSRPTGKGEAAAKRNLKTLFMEVDPGHLPDDTPQLIDMAALERAGYPPEEFMKLYIDMVCNMHSLYQSHKDWSLPIKAFEAQSMIMPKPDIPESPEMEEVRWRQDLVSSIGRKVASYARLMMLAAYMGIINNERAVFARNLGWVGGDPNYTAPLASDKKALEETQEERGPLDILNAIKAIQMEGVDWMIERNTLILAGGNDELVIFINAALDFLRIPIAGPDLEREIMEGYGLIVAMKEELLALLGQQLPGPSGAGIPAQGAP